MLEKDQRDPRAPGDTRMYLYFDYSPLGALRWYVKVSRKGRRIGISEEYGTNAFDAAYDAAITTLGRMMRKRAGQFNSASIATRNAKQYLTSSPLASSRPRWSSSSPISSGLAGRTDRSSLGLSRVLPLERMRSNSPKNNSVSFISSSSLHHQTLHESIRAAPGDLAPRLNTSHLPNESPSHSVR